MSQQLTQEIQTRTKEIADLEKRLEAIQTAETAPVADEFDNATDFMQAMRDFHTSERDRIDELAAIEAVLPPSRAKLQELQDRFDGIKSPVEQHFEEYANAALEANKLFEQAEKAFEDVFEMARKQAELGHQTVFGTQPFDIVATPSFPIFCVSSNKVAVLPRKQYRDYKNAGRISEGTRV